MNIRVLSLTIAALLACSAASASEPAGAPAAPDAQATRAEIDRLIERIETLSGQLGEDANVRVIVRRGGRDAPMALPGEGMKRHIRMERMPADGPMKRSGPGLGIVLAPNPAAGGVRIVAVSPESPAGAAGLRSDDVLLSVDGRAVAGNGEHAVDNARELLGDLKQGQKVQLRYAREGKIRDASVTADSIRRVMVINRDGMQHRHDGMMFPKMEMELERIGPMAKCPPGDDDCGMPALFQAFRWQGLNLASVDASLGRYFGTTSGVLVLSSGPELKGLQSGDVIRRVEGKPVDSPREVMRELRQRDVGSNLQLEVLRDRKALPLTLVVPKSRPLPFMAPPAPPAPPSPPRAAPPAMPVPPAPPPPPPAR